MRQSQSCAKESTFFLWASVAQPGGKQSVAAIEWYGTARTRDDARRQIQCWT